jgi:hypothetical protein
MHRHGGFLISPEAYSILESTITSLASGVSAASSAELHTKIEFVFGFVSIYNYLGQVLSRDLIVVHTRGRCVFTMILFLRTIETP